jgi:hypothetical protein
LWATNPAGSYAPGNKQSESSQKTAALHTTYLVPSNASESGGAGKTSGALAITTCFAKGIA